ncbi:MAG: FecR family protein [Chitinophagaceae bacterium]
MKKDYLDFTEKDFISDAFFQQWVKLPDAKNRIFWEQWLIAHPEKHSDVIKAKAFIENLHFNTQLPSSLQIENSLSRSLERINALEADKKVLKLQSRMKYTWWAAAAVFFCCVIIIALPSRTERPITIEIVARPGEIKTITLPDSSIVTLNAGSHFTYLSNFQNTGKREVWLDGEAYFDVRHLETDNSSRLFIVHCNDLNVEVLGTTFNIRKKGSITNVTLNSGKIRIGVKDTPGSTILMEPGDFIQHYDREKRIIRKEVNPELYSVWKEKKMILDNTSLADIAELIQDTYLYKVQIAEKDLARQKISGTLVLTDEEVMLQTLSLALDIDIIKKDTALIFQSKNKKKKD